jgi:hypothetical protein
MPRKSGQHKAEQLRLSVPPVIKKYLRQLVATGLYGNSEPEAAMRLIEDAIEGKLERKVLTVLDRETLEGKS